MQTTISKENNLVTLINVFTVDPQDQQVLIDILVEATEKVMKNIQGFISANIHDPLSRKPVTLVMGGMR